MTTAWTITIDCGHPTNLANFWKLALGYVDAPPPVGFDSWREWLIACDVPEAEWGDGASLVDPEGVAPSLSLLRVPEGKHAKNRLHIDLQMSGGRTQPTDVRRSRITAAVERLIDAGACRLQEHTVAGELDHVVLADPEGNEFCVV